MVAPTSLSPKNFCIDNCNVILEQFIDHGSFHDGIHSEVCYLCEYYLSGQNRPTLNHGIYV